MASTGRRNETDKFQNREQLFNKFKAFSPEFNSEAARNFINAQYNELFKVKQYDTGDPRVQDVSQAVQSLANRFALFQYKGITNSNFLAEDYLDKAGSKLIDEQVYKTAQNPTPAKIIDYFQESGSLATQYSWADFLYAKYLHRIPNNYMITLRRFNFPVIDNIFDAITFDHKSGNMINIDQPDISRAITWMSEVTGNKLEDIITWSNSFDWQEIESEVQTLTSNAQGITGSGILGIGSTGFGPAAAISSIATLGSGTNTAAARTADVNAGFDPLSETYRNYEFGPIDVIKKMLIRKAGLNFNQEFEIKFHYDLRSHGEINPKMAFCDILSNLLVLTYNNAPFWGGATRYIGNGRFGKPLGSHDKLAAGDVNGFLKSIVSDGAGLLSNVFGDGEGGFSVDSIFEGIGNVGADMLGGLLSEKLNTPQRAQVAQAYLTGEPTGEWHMTIGNPLNPICAIGNLTLHDAKFQFKGPLSRDDFPTELEVTLTLKPGRPRDKGEIETIFNAGRGRLYHAPEGFDDVLNIEGIPKDVSSGQSRDANSTTGFPQGRTGTNEFRGTNSNQNSPENYLENRNKFTPKRFASSGEKFSALLLTSQKAVIES